MTYTSLIFLFGIFPLSAMISLLDRSAEYKNLILIITSLLFFSWGRPFAVCLIFISVIIDWLLGFAAGAFREKAHFMGLIPVAVSGLMNILIIYMYNWGKLPGLGDAVASRGSPETYITGIGMAFYALKGFSYVYDNYTGKIRPDKNIFCLMTYMLAYDMLIVGPAVRYGDMESQIRSREVTTEKLNEGLNRFFWGLGKVVLLAGLFKRIKLVGLSSAEITTMGCWLGMIAFVMQYYFLFTGLCDISRGLCLVNGFVLPVNYKDIEPDELFTGTFGSYNSTVVGFFSEMFGITGNNKAVGRILRTFFCYALVCAWYTAKDNGGAGFIAAGVLVCGFVLLEQCVLRFAMKYLPAFVKYAYILAVCMLVFGAVYFDSTKGFGSWFLSYRNWLGGLIGVHTKHFMSSSVNSLIIKNITLIVISFFIVCPHAKKAVLDRLEKRSGSSRKAYGMVRGLKTICTAFVFLLSAITLVAEIAP